MRSWFIRFKKSSFVACVLHVFFNDLKNNCNGYNIPVVGGNVSLYNTTGNNSIYPTPIIVMMGIS